MPRTLEVGSVHEGDAASVPIADRCHREYQGKTAAETDGRAHRQVLVRGKLRASDASSRQRDRRCPYPARREKSRPAVRSLTLVVFSRSAGPVSAARQCDRYGLANGLSPLPSTSSQACSMASSSARPRLNCGTMSYAARTSAGSRRKMRGPQSARGNPDAGLARDLSSNTWTRAGTAAMDRGGILPGEVGEDGSAQASA